MFSPLLTHLLHDNNKCYVSPTLSHLHINCAFTEKTAAGWTEKLPCMIFVIKNWGIQQYR